MLYWNKRFLERCRLKIVLLPGMDGTGKMFAPILLKLAGHETTVIPLPESGAQDYAALDSYVQSRLPDEDFVLMAESFSGPIALEIAVREPKQLKGVVLVATFLSSPSRFLLGVSNIMPLGLLVKLPFIRAAYKALLFGRGAAPEMIDQFSDLMRNVNPEVIRERLKSVRGLNDGEACEDIGIPCVYLQASDDRLVESSKAGEFADIFIDFQIEQVRGPHFLLQANPQGCWTVIEKFLSRLAREQG